MFWPSGRRAPLIASWAFASLFARSSSNPPDVALLAPRRASWITLEDFERSFRRPARPAKQSYNGLASALTSNSACSACRLATVAGRANNPASFFVDSACRWETKF